MSENQDQKKPRAKRSASKFLVLRDITAHVSSFKDDATQQVVLNVLGIKQGQRVLLVEREPTGIKAARAEIIKQKIVGDLLTVCVRRRGTSTVQTTLELKGL